MKHHTFIAIDVETTGLHAGPDRVIEIALCYVQAGQVVGTWSTLINPQRQLPALITQLTGITAADVGAAPVFSTQADAVARRLEGRDLVAHNAEFDRDFIIAEFERLGLDVPQATWHCTLELAQTVLPYAGRHTLAHVAALCGVSNPQPHRAAPDAATAAAVWQRLGELQQASHHCGVSTRENAPAERLAWELHQCGVELRAGVQRLDVLYDVLPKHGTQQVVGSTVGEYCEGLRRAIAASDVSPCPGCGARWRHTWVDPPVHTPPAPTVPALMAESLW